MVLRSWLVETYRRGGSIRTVTEYHRILVHFLARFPAPGLVQPLDVHFFAYGPGPTGWQPSASTVAVRLAAIAGMYSFAVRVGITDVNPAENIRRPRPAQPVPRGQTIDELRELLAAIPTTATGARDRAMVLTILLTGLRRDEITSLRITDLDLTSGRYIVRVKGGRERQRRMPAPALAAIVDWLGSTRRSLETVPSDERLFGITATALYANVRRYAARAGLSAVTPHSLRHSAAQLRRLTGATVEDVSALLGHASIATTATYLRRLDAERDDAWPAAAAVLGIATPAADRAIAPVAAAGRHPMVWTPRRPRPAITERPDGCANTRPAQAIGAQHSARLPTADSSGP